ncbi:Uncharacterised protein [Actinobaculum suis]|uniref:Uncharacterized protein n=1 Tax=Actinobaculum suis TaxID=1657 RepID=A0A7Z8Y8S5_9ACTO|nr:hypothetical protein [Actinobaculum suis]VDG75793.1 Uncharacterised protein [Actinobaculum suis]
MEFPGRRSELDEMTDKVFQAEIAALEVKRVAMRKLVAAVEVMEQAHAEVLKQRDALEAAGMRRASIIKAVAPSTLAARVLRSKAQNLQAQKDVSRSGEGEGGVSGGPGMAGEEHHE